MEKKRTNFGKCNHIVSTCTLLCKTKNTFFFISVTLCTDLLPKTKPVYCMGVGYAEDLVVCVALGVDMFDCVFPTRTAVSIVQSKTSSFTYTL